MIPLDTIFYTPLGEAIKYRDLERLERVLCDNDDCQLAVVEDEHIPCEDCDGSYCLYCWERNYWECPGCGKVHATMRDNDEQPPAAGQGGG